MTRCFSSWCKSFCTLCFIITIRKMIADNPMPTSKFMLNASSQFRRSIFESCAYITPFNFTMLIISEPRFYVDIFNVMVMKCVIKNCLPSVLFYSCKNTFIVMAFIIMWIMFIFFVTIMFRVMMFIVIMIVVCVTMCWNTIVCINSAKWKT